MKFGTLLLIYHHQYVFVFDVFYCHTQLQFLAQSSLIALYLIQEFVQNYAALLPNGKKSTREDVDAFLTSMDNNTTYKNFQVGKTKVVYSVIISGYIVGVVVVVRICLNIVCICTLCVRLCIMCTYFMYLCCTV